jgi:hypothetical protein
MKITEQSVRKITITGVENLDTINVVFEDFGPGQGRIMVECFGDAWAHYWGAMGSESVAEFVMTADEDYITGKLYSGHNREPDYDFITEKTGRCITNDIEMVENEDKLSEVFGPDWRMDYPTRIKHDYLYLRRIVATIQQALKLHAESDTVNNITAVN